MNHINKKIAVIGGGSWATAIVKILAANLPHVYWWVREPEIEEGIKTNGRNPLYLSSVLFNNKKTRISTNLKKVVAKSDVLVLVTPSAYLYSTLSELSPKHFQNKSVVSAIKGIVPEQMKTISVYMEDTFGVSADRFGVISGPSHAEEIASERLTYLTSGSSNLEFAEFIAHIFSTNYVKTRTSSDMQGIEFSIILKNIYALGGGILRGTGAGDNLLAVFNTNCINEMVHFIESVFPNPDRNVFTAPYLGDFLVTTYSQFSRNRSFGIMIGKGYSVRTAQLEMKMVAEGYNAVKCIHELNLVYKVDTPIIESVYRILYENASLKLEIPKLFQGLQ